MPFSASRSIELTSRSQIIVAPQYTSQAKPQYSMSYPNKEIKPPSQKSNRIQETYTVS